MNSLIVSQCYKDAEKKSNNPSEKNFTAKCKLCPNKVISGNLNNSSNFLKHIQEQHPGDYKQFEVVKGQVGSRKRKIDELADQLDTSGTVTKKPQRQSLIQVKSASSVLSQSEFDSALCFMISSDMMPLATVERKGFVAFCEKVAPQCVLMSRRTLGRRISQLYSEKKQTLISELQKVEWLSATADAWSSHKRAFMGVTVHYVDPVSFEMRSTVLGVRRFKHAHTSEAIAKILLSMLNEFNIRSRVQNVVTDNAANFSKAFTIVVDKSEVNENPTTIMTNAEFEEVDDVNDGDCDDNDDEREVIHVFDGLCSAVESDDVEALPPHKLCGNHTLNLVTSTDSLKARDDRTYKRCYDRAMAKVQALSNSVNRSPKMNDIVEEIIGTTFINPTSTRWSSNFNAIQRIISIGFEKVKLCQAALKQEMMTDNDMTFLTSYAKVMKPLVLAMTLLQSETTTYLGHLIPTIMGLKCKLDQSTDRLVEPLVRALSAGIDSRFQEILADKEHLIASVLHPQFKLNFLPEDARLGMKRQVLAYVQKVADDGNDMINEICATTTSADIAKEEDDDLFSFMNSSTGQDAAQQSSLSQELENFLDSRCSTVQSLKDYPNIGKAFVKANSTLPSSAAVERLFSVAGMILTPRRCKISDSLFDKMVFLKSRSSSW